jgi:hypothetical protein
LQQLDYASASPKFERELDCMGGEIRSYLHYPASSTLGSVSVNEANVREVVRHSLGIEVMSESVVC